MNLDRKIDVDAFDEDNEETLTTSQNDQEQEYQFNQRSATVKSLMSRGDLVGALRASLENPPLGSSSAQLKAKNLALVISVLNSIKPADFAVEQFDVDTICKYVYKGMEFPETYNTSTLLAWHEKLVQVGGIGLLVRVLTDERTA